MKRKGLTWDEHGELGGELKRMNEFFEHLDIKLCERYGKTTIAPRHAEAARYALKQLRHTLAFEMLPKDCPDKSDYELMHVYTGRSVGK